MQAPELCKDCGRRCCTRPALTTDEYLVMHHYVGNARLQEFNPKFMENNVWMFRTGTCPALTDKGCIMPYKVRPLMCRLFPWLSIPVYTDTVEDVHNELVLMVSRCPKWQEFGERYEQIKEELRNG